MDSQQPQQPQMVLPHASSARPQPPDLSKINYSVPMQMIESVDPDHMDQKVRNIPITINFQY